MKKTNFARTLLSFLVAQTIPLAAFAADGGTLEGQLQRVKDKRPVVGARITVKETGAEAVTGPNGAYTFRDVAPGIYTLVVKANGTTTLEKQVTVAAQKTSRENLEIAEPMTALETITVLAQFTPYAIARAAQQEAPNLVNITTAEEMRKLPDVSTAETVRRLPGISLETDTGEGRFINIRGLDADLNSTTFGGLRLPPSNNATPFAGGRAVALDAIPTGLVGALTVTKTNCPSKMRRPWAAPLRSHRRQRHAAARLSFKAILVQDANPCAARTSSISPSRQVAAGVAVRRQIQASLPTKIVHFLWW